MNFSAKHALLAIAVGMGGAMLLQKQGVNFGFGDKTVPALSYTDTKGVSRALNASGKPTLVVLWVTPCSYCTRSMNVLDTVRRLYPESDLDIVGFYLNTTSDADLDRMAASEGRTFTMARGQPTGEFVQQLLGGLDFHGTGRDIYVIGPDGHYTTVDASDLSKPDYGVLQQVRSLLINKHHLKERV
jgi:hypothetical protein